MEKWENWGRLQRCTTNFSQFTLTQKFLAQNGQDKHQQSDAIGLPATGQQWAISILDDDDASIGEKE